MGYCCCAQRFELNYETFTRQKLNDKFEFPHSLDLYPFSTEGVAWADAQAKRVAEAQAAAAAASASQEDAGSSEVAGGGTPVEKSEPARAPSPVVLAELPRTYNLHPPEYYEFELAGVVIHLGTADSGHYYSLIRERGTGPDAAWNMSSSEGAPSCAGISVGKDASFSTDQRVAAQFAQADATRRDHANKWFEFNDSNVTVSAAVCCVFCAV